MLTSLMRTEGWMPGNRTGMCRMCRYRVVWSGYGYVVFTWYVNNGFVEEK